MADSLRDQLLKSGIVKQVRDDRRAPAPAPARDKVSRPNNPRPAPAKRAPRDQAEIDLARAYAMRAQTEAAERKRQEKEAAERARIKRERKAQVQKLLESGTLNKPDADQARHFEYGGKIRRVYVDADQLTALNAGELGVIQQGGRYLLVPRALAEQIKAIDEQAVALLVNPGDDAPEDGVPDDLIW
ncbi:DUF2058 domain-containing protein [Dyella sp.]|jgi:uncharacterized protein YaiL (DUF2058 family)|uniref:DUF2058 domain-containing protein n=1 Tax=Dyella sp. TaxID=1869338 RepID=UPI002D7A1071|nr:DUF2058 family protein [Dyella sp.]HET6431470.1 DUF2058 family protein [Dyella sp.]